LNQVLKRLRWLWLLLPLGLAGNIGLVMLCRGPELVGSLRGASPFLLALSAAMCFVPWFCNALRLRIWTGFLGRSLRYSECLRISLISELGAAASPTASGGGPFKAALLMEHGFKAPQAVSLTLLGSLEDGMWLFPLVGTAVIFGPSGRMVATTISNVLVSHVTQALIIALAAISMVTVFWMLARFGKYPQRLYRLLEKARSLWFQTSDCLGIIIGPGRGKFLKTMPLAALQWSCRYTALAVILSGFGIGSNPVDIFLLQWTTFTLMNLIPTPGAAGGAEAAFIFIHRMVVPYSLLPLAAASWRLITYYLPVSTAALVILASNMKLKSKKQIQNDTLQSPAQISPSGLAHYAESI
jgi:hypothetical protein